MDKIEAYKAEMQKEFFEEERKAKSELEECFKKANELQDRKEKMIAYSECVKKQVNYNAKLEKARSHAALIKINMEEQAQELDKRMKKEMEQFNAYTAAAKDDRCKEIIATGMKKMQVAKEEFRKNTSALIEETKTKVLVLEKQISKMDTDPETEKTLRKNIEETNAALKVNQEKLLENLRKSVKETQNSFIEAGCSK